MLKSLSQRFAEACKNSQKSAVVGGGDGESARGSDLGDGKHDEDAGDKLEHGVPAS